MRFLSGEHLSLVRTQASRLSRNWPPDRIYIYLLEWATLEDIRNARSSLRKGRRYGFYNPGTNPCFLIFLSRGSVVKKATIIIIFLWYYREK